MRVDEVNVIPVKPNNGLIGFASVVIDKCWYLGSIGVHTKLDGTYRLTYPTKMTGSRTMNIFHPINRETSKVIEAAIFEKCKEIFKGGNENDRYNQDCDSDK